MSSWSFPYFTKAEIRRAGMCVVKARAIEEAGMPLGQPLGEEYYKALGLLYGFRAAHGFPLNTVQLTLRRKAKSVDEKAVVAQRLKRFASIYKKLARFHAMKLDTMQDIGGCRAIMSSVHLARRLSLSYESNPRLRGCIGDRKKDYIADPKKDGYRSIHLVYRFDSKSPARSSSPW